MKTLKPIVVAVASVAFLTAAKCSSNNNSSGSGTSTTKLEFCQRNDIIEIPQASLNSYTNNFKQLGNAISTYSPLSDIDGDGRDDALLILSSHPLVDSETAGIVSIPSDGPRFTEITALTDADLSSIEKRFNPLATDLFSDSSNRKELVVGLRDSTNEAVKILVLEMDDQGVYNSRLDLGLNLSGLDNKDENDRATHATVVAMDLDDDNDLDIVISYRATGSTEAYDYKVVSFENLGGKSFRATPSTIYTESGDEKKYFSIAKIVLNNSSNEKLVLVRGTVDNLPDKVLASAEIFSFDGNGNATGNTNIGIFDLPSVAINSSLRVIDYDGDGKQDIYLTGSAIALINTSPATGTDFSFKSTKLLSDGAEFQYYQSDVVDLDGDDDADYIESYQGSIAVIGNAGQSTKAGFSSSRRSAVVNSSSYSPFLVGDFDGDGDNDLLTLVQDQANDRLDMNFGENQGSCQKVDFSINATPGAIEGEDTVTLTSTLASANDASRISSYSWSIIKVTPEDDFVANTTIDNSDQANASILVPDVIEDTLITFQLKIVDNFGVISTEEVTIAARPEPFDNPDEV
jgi:hypothetical protein